MEAPDILFDLGGVLIEWDPRRVYRPLFAREADMERFLAEVCSPAWNLTMDAGRPIAEAIRTLQAAHPEQADLIERFGRCWAEMLGGAVPGTVELFRALKARGLKVCALSNWSAETFPIARARFEFLGWFDRIVISGELGLAKPDPAIYREAIRLCDLVPERTLFIDDVPANVAAARAQGMDAILFQGAGPLRAELAARGLVPPAAK